MSRERTMLNSLNRRSHRLVIVTGCATAMVVAWLMAARVQMIEIDLQADSGGIVRLQWTTPGREFTQDRSVFFTVGAERQTYRVLVTPRKSVFHFKLKFAQEMTSPRIHSAGIERVGRDQSHYDAGDLVEHIQSAGDVSAPKARDNALVLAGGLDESTMRFDGLRSGDRYRTSTGFVVGAVAILGALLYLLARLGLLAKLPSRYLIAAVGIFAWLPLAATYLPLWLIVSLRAVTVGVAGAILLCYWLRDRSRAASGVSSRAILAAGFAVAIFWCGVAFLPNLPGFDVLRLTQLATGESPRVEFEGYLEQQFPSRASLIELDAEVKIFGLGVSSTPKVFLGDDGFMFEGRGERRVEGDDVKLFDNVSDYLGRIPFTDSQLQAWALALTERRNWLRDQGIPYLFVLAPTKDMIYSDKLPARLRRHGGETRRYDQLVAYLHANTDVPMLDLRPRLLRERKVSEYPELYYRTDFHWNFLGSFLAYEEIINALNEEYSQFKLKPLVRDDFDIRINERWAHPRFMRTLGLDPKVHGNEHHLTFVPRDRERFPDAGVIPKDGIRDVAFPIEKLQVGAKEINVRTIRNSQGDLPLVVVYGDSFIQKSLIYLSVHARRLVYQRAVFDFPLDVFAAGEKPDLVIQEVLNMYILRDAPVNPALIKKAVK